MIKDKFDYIKILLKFFLISQSDSSNKSNLFLRKSDSFHKWKVIYFLERKMIHFINEKWIFLKNILCDVYILNKKITTSKAKTKPSD